MKKFIAFTLAETLIVMGIIGIVSALTLPNLNSSTGEKEKIAKVKKIYQNLTDAYGRAVAVYGPYEDWNANSTRLGERLSDFLKISKNCETNNTGCFNSEKPKEFGGTELPLFEGYQFILADGTSVAISDYIYVDIDGPNKGQTTIGKDIFIFEIYDNELIPLHNNVVSGTSCGYSCVDGPDASPLGHKDYFSDCAAHWVINFDNMDYLKIDDDNKCPNGTTLSLSKITCK